MGLADFAKKAGNAAKAGAQQAQQPKPAAIAGRVGNLARRGAQQSRGYRPPSQPSPRYSQPQSQSQSLGTSPTGEMAQVMSAPAVMPDPTPPPPPQMTQDEWNAQDSAYLSEESGLKMTLDQALAQLADQRKTYQTDFGAATRNLGWNWQDGNNDGIADDDELKAGSWDPTNQQGAYGQAWQNQQNDFSSRGMLDSSFYGDAVTELNRGFTNQYDQSMTARNNYLAQIASGEGQARDTSAAGLERARLAATERRAAHYAGLGG